ncbi:MAG TPA: hypothetical protein VNB95_04085, partial [Nitrososphaera sp.]|nr:hypothetical protein [Nitrososphaera sp.]
GSVVYKVDILLDMMHRYPILKRNSPHWYLKNIRSSRDIIITIITMRLAARIGIIIIVLLILATVWWLSGTSEPCSHRAKRVNGTGMYAN